MEAPPPAEEIPRHIDAGDHQIGPVIDDYYHGVRAPELDTELKLDLNFNLNLMNCNSDYDYCSSQLESTSTLVKGPVTASFWDQNLDFEFLSCTEILGLADDGLVGSQQSQSGLTFNVEQIANPSAQEEKAKAKEKDGVPATPEKKKNQKTSTEMNKKPGEKRQNKYYWPKIDTDKKPTPKPKTPKPVTPKPKTPKPVTPKPRRNHIKKSKGTPGGGSKMPEAVLPERMKGEPSCKRALNFEHEKMVNIGLDSELGVSACSSFPEKRAWGFEDCRVNSSNLSFNSNALSCNETTMINPSMCILPNLERSGLIQPCSLQEERPPLQSEEKISTESEERKSLRVYHRRLKSKCLKECRKLGLNYPEAYKRKRVSRDRNPILRLKKFEGFNRFSICVDLLDRILTVRGKKRMILPTKGAENAQELFPCVLSLLSVPIKLSTKRRSTKRISRRPSPLIMESASPENDGTAKLDSPLDATFTGNNQAEPQVLDTKESNPGNLNHPSSVQSATVGSSNVKVSQTKATKKKKGRPNKSKRKHYDYLSGLSDWGSESLEQVIEPLVQHFESMELYDNPKTLERWSVLNNDEENKGDSGREDAYEEKEKWEEERKALLQRIAKFIYVMTRSQGPRDFVKWKGSVLDSVVGVFLTQNVSDVLSSNAYIELGSRYPLKSPSNENEESSEYSELESSQGSSSESPSNARSATNNVVIELPEEESLKEDEWKSKDFDAALNDMFAYLAESKGKGKEVEEREKIDWEAIKVKICRAGNTHQHRNPDARDSIDWNAVRIAPTRDIAKAIINRGQHQIIAAKIQRTLNRLVEQHGSLDLEWLREAPTQVAKAYLLSFYGLGIKSVECLRLLTLHHHAFPVDVNIARVSVRLGWVPLKPLPMGLPFHQLEKYPLEGEIQKYLWLRLCHLDQKILYRLHCHMITFGKIFCVKKNPNCGACPFKGECKYYTSLITSKLPLPRTQGRRAIKSKKACKSDIKNPFDLKGKSSRPFFLPRSTVKSCTEISRSYHHIDHFPTQKSCEPIIEMPPSPEPDPEPIEPELPDIEDLFTDTNNDEIVSEIKLNLSEEFKPELYDHYYFEENNMDHIAIGNHNEELSRALVNLSPEEASIPLPKHMLAARLRTEHQVYEIPDSHPLLNDFDRREEKDPLPYLLAVWTPDQMKKVAESLEESEKVCVSQENAQEESLTIPGTLLIPSRTAMRGYFPLNGTYFQVNEVFADDESSQRPIDVPRRLLWNLPKRTLYCGSGITSIFRGLTWREIQRCCCHGFVCTRGFNRKTRAPKKLHSRLHIKTKLQEDEE